MNREIKFRAWDKENNRMIYPSTNGVCFELDDYGIGILDVSGDYPEDHIFPTINSVLMQWTSLKDKNGVEIYEGDIVKNIRNGISRKVYWDTHCASFHLSKRGREKPGVEYWSLSNPKWNYEVIGNIYENPELLKEGN